MNKSQELLSVLEDNNQKIIEQILTEMIKEKTISNQDELDINIIALSDQYNISDSFAVKLFKKLVKQHKLPKSKIK